MGTINLIANKAAEKSQYSGKALGTVCRSQSTFTKGLRFLWRLFTCSCSGQAP